MSLVEPTLPIDVDTTSAIRRGANRLARRLRHERPPGSLSAGKLAVLGHLSAHGQASPGEIAAAEHQQPQSLTRVLGELEDAGLIARSRSPSDGRSFILSLTDVGRDALSEDMAVRDAWLSAALSQLTAVELEVLRLGALLMDRVAATEPT